MYLYIKLNFGLQGSARVIRSSIKDNEGEKEFELPAQTEELLNTC